MDIEGLKRTAKDITSFSAKALLVYEMTQVGGQVQTLEAADISTPETTMVHPTNSPEQETPSEQLGYISQFVAIPAFHVLTKEEANQMTPDQIAKYSEQQITEQNLLSGWVELTKIAATSPTSNFYSTDFEALVRTVTQNGESYNVPEARLIEEVPLTINNESFNAPKNSLLIPYTTNQNELAVAIMSDKIIENKPTTVGSYIASFGDKTIAIPARFDTDNNPISFMEFVANANGALQPQEVPVIQAKIISDQTNVRVRDAKDPSIIVGQIEKGTKISIIGLETKPVKEKNIRVSLALTPSGNVVSIATTLYEKVDTTGAVSSEKISNENNLPIVDGKYIGKQVEGSIDLNVSAFVTGRNKNGNPTSITLDGVQYPIMNAIAKIGFVNKEEGVYGYNISASAYYLGVLGKRTITNLDISDDLKSIVINSAMTDETKQILLDSYSIESLEVMDYLALTRNKQGVWVKEVFSLTSPQTNAVYTGNNQPLHLTPAEKLKNDLRPGRAIGTYSTRILNMPWVVENYTKTWGAQNFPIELEESIPQIQTLNYSNLVTNFDTLASGGAQIVVVGFCNVTVI